MIKARGRSRSRDINKQLLYTYPEARQRLAELEADHMTGRRREQQARRGNLPGDPTGRAGAALAEDREAAALEWHVKTVERALERVRQECAPSIAAAVLEMAERVYFRREMTFYGYAARIGKAEKTVRRWNKILLTKLDEEARS